MVIIPKILQKPEYRFIPVTKEKRPLQKNYLTTNNYAYNDDYLISKLQQGYNCAILTGFGDLCVFDFDNIDFYKEIEPQLKQTLTVKTGKGFHKYYKLPNVSSTVIKDQYGKNLIEIFGNKKFVVCPNSIHATGKQYKIITSLPPSPLRPEELTNIKNPKVVSSFFSFLFSPPSNKLTNSSFQSSILSKDYHFDLKTCYNNPIMIKIIGFTPNLKETYKDRKILLFIYKNHFYWRDLNKICLFNLRQKFGHEFFGLNQVIEISSTLNFNGQKNTYTLVIR